MRIIIYVPETAQAESIFHKISTALPENSHVTDYAIDGDDLHQMLRLYHYDAAIVAVDGASKRLAINGLSILNRRKDSLPTIALTHNVAAENMIDIWRSGASAVLSMDENDHLALVLPQIAQNLSNLHRKTSQVIEAGAFRYDQADGSVTYNGRDIGLTPQEQVLLIHMIKNEKRILSKESIYDVLYALDSDLEVEQKIIDVYVHKVRAKLKAIDPAAENSIETVWGQGYRFSGMGSELESHQKRKFGPLTIDYTDLKVSWDDQDIPLSVSEYMVLKTLAFKYPHFVPAKALEAASEQFGRGANFEAALKTLDRKLRAISPQLDGLVKRGADGSATLNLLRIDPKLVVVAANDITILGPFKNNLALEEITYQGKILDLTRTQYLVLSTLIDAFPNYLNQEQIAERVYGEPSQTSKIYPHIVGLSKVLRDVSAGGQLLVSRHGIGYALDIESKRLNKKFNEKSAISVFEKGPWRIDEGRWQIDYIADSKTQALRLSKAQFILMRDMIRAYPEHITLENASKMQLYYQLRSALSEQLGEWRGGLRKLDDNGVRLDLDPCDITDDILKQCDIVEAGPWSCNKTLQQISFDGDFIALSNTQVKFIECLVDAYPAPLNAQTISRHLGIQETSVNTLIAQTRKYLSEKHAITDWINNVRGSGYVLQANKDELTQEKIAATKTTSIGEVTLNHDLRALEYDGKEISLSAAEYAVLEVLRNATKPLNCSEISDETILMVRPYEEVSVYQAVKSMSEKLDQNGVGKDAFILQVATGYYLSSRLEDLKLNSERKEIGPLVLDYNFMTVSHAVNGSAQSFTAQLTPSEFALLHALSANPRVPLKTADIAALKTEEGEAFSEATFKVVKTKIRTKLEAVGDPEPDILSVKSGGYFFTHMDGQIDTARSQIVMSQEMPAILEAGDLKIHTIARTVSYRGENIDTIRGPVFDLLVLLTQNHAQMHTAEELAQRLLGDSKLSRSIEMGMNGLRNSFNKSVTRLGDTLIFTDRRGTAFALCADDVSAARLKAENAKATTLSDFQGKRAFNT